jgi:hypothetical protein
MDYVAENARELFAALSAADVIARSALTDADDAAGFITDESGGARLTAVHS